MKTEVLKILREAGEYVSGQQLCEHFGVSRTAVWKVIRQLKEEGYEIEAVKNRGYRMGETPDVMTMEELKSRLGTVWMGQECIYLESVDSTNTCAKRLAEEGRRRGRWWWQRSRPAEKADGAGAGPLKGARMS